MAVSLVLGSACGVGPAPGGTGETTPSAGFTAQEPTTSPVRPTCRINDKVATSRASALSQWGEPCSRDVFGDVETWSYAVTRCRLETYAGPLDDFCPLSCDATTSRYTVTFTRDIVSECEAQVAEPATVPTYSLKRYEHHDSAATVAGSQCPGGEVLLGGSCGCDGAGTLQDAGLVGTHLSTFQCACSAPGVSVYISCLGASVPGALMDATP